METLRKYITVDPEIQNGQPVFSGTRVPVETLFWHLEKGISIDEFLEDFPSVTKEQAIAVIVLNADDNTYLTLRELVPQIKVILNKHLPTGPTEIKATT